MPTDGLEIFPGHLRDTQAQIVGQAFEHLLFFGIGPEGDDVQYRII